MNDFEGLDLLKDINNLLGIFEYLEPRYLEIISYRNNFNNEFKTYEAIGNIYGLSRERIRQLEKSATNKLRYRFIRIKAKITLEKVYNYITNSTKLAYITIDTLFNFLGDKRKAFMLAYLYNLTNFHIIYDKTHKIIYDKNTTNIIDVLVDIVDVLKYSYTIQEFNELPYSAQSIVKKEFLFTHDVYKKRGINLAKEIVDVIKRMFPLGFRPSNKEQLDILNAELKKYNFIFDDYNSRELFALLDREDFCLIDRGTYIHKDSIIMVPDSLLDRILIEIKNSIGNIYYKDLYEQFKNELIELGINNYYYFKGIIDLYLDDDYSKTKDYIVYNNVCPKKIVMPTIEYDEHFETHMSNTKITVEDKKKYRKEEPLSPDAEIYLSKKIKDIDFVTTKAIEKFIKYSFKKNNSRKINIISLYDILETEYKALQEEIPFINSPQALKMLLLDKIDYLCNCKDDIVSLKNDTIKQKRRGYR